jgi:hypothetical protein
MYVALLWKQRRFVMVRRHKYAMTNLYKAKRELSTLYTPWVLEHYIFVKQTQPRSTHWKLFSLVSRGLT